MSTHPASAIAAKQIENSVLIAVLIALLPLVRIDFGMKPAVAMPDGWSVGPRSALRTLFPLRAVRARNQLPASVLESTAQAGISIAPTNFRVA
jgi:hypothetical protein